MSIVAEISFTLKLCALLGIIPCYRRKHRGFVVSWLYSVAVPIITVSATCWSIVATILRNRSHHWPLVSFLVVLLTLKVIYVFQSVAVTIYKFKSFNYLIQSLSQFDSIVPCTTLKSNTFLKYSAFALLLVLSCSYTSFAYNYDPRVILVPNLTIIWNSHGTLLRYFLLDMILQRIRTLEAVISKSTYASSIVEIATQSYNVICDCISLFNELFKWLVFLDFIIMYVTVIDEIRHALIIDTNILESSKGWPAIVKCGFVMFLQLIFVVKCEQLKSALEDVGSHAIRIASSTALQSKSSLVVMLVCVVGGKQPTITAGGVFTMGVSEVFAFFNLAVTYVIVIISLNDHNN